MIVKVFHWCLLALVFNNAFNNMKMPVNIGASHWRGGQGTGEKFGVKFQQLLTECLDECLYVFVAEVCANWWLRSFADYYSLGFLNTHFRIWNWMWIWIWNQLGRRPAGAGAVGPAVVSTTSAQPCSGMDCTGTPVSVSMTANPMLHSSSSDHSRIPTHHRAADGKWLFN